MTDNTRHLLTVAAELRAGGYQWEAIAQRVEREASTCQKWPKRYKFEWNRLYHGAQQRRFEETNLEVHTHLRKMLRGDDLKAKTKVMELWMKWGADMCKPPSDWETPSVEEMQKQSLKSMDQELREERRVFGQLYRERLAAGLPPPSDDDLEEAWEKHEAEQELRRTAREYGVMVSQLRKPAVAPAFATALLLIAGFVACWPKTPTRLVADGETSRVAFMDHPIRSSPDARNAGAIDDDIEHVVFHPGGTHHGAVGLVGATRADGLEAGAAFGAADGFTQVGLVVDEHLVSIPLSVESLEVLFQSVVQSTLRKGWLAPASWPAMGTRETDGRTETPPRMAGESTFIGTPRDDRGQGLELAGGWDLAALQDDAETGRERTILGGADRFKIVLGGDLDAAIGELDADGTQVAGAFHQIIEPGVSGMQANKLVGRVADAITFAKWNDHRCPSLHRDNVARVNPASKDRIRERRLDSIRYVSLQKGRTGNANGEGGKLFTPFSHSSENTANRTQFLPALKVTKAVLVVVLCGCLALSGIISSTLSAHCWIANPSPSRAVMRSARRSGRPSQSAPITRVGGSYCRYSSELQDDSSIEQQQRKCRERAASDGVPMTVDLEFADAAVSGTKLRRLGLDGLMAAARAGRLTDVYFESLSRLARESVITMPMLKDLVYNCRVRIVSVSEGIDSSQANWEMQASFLAWMHEQFLKTLRAAVLRGQEHAILNDWSSGDWCFGYASEPIPGSEAGRRGRLPRPRMRVIINPDHAAWVKQIFQWFVIDGWKIDRIMRELTKRNAPKDHRATRPGWHHDYVKRALRNEKYIGVWPWGKNTNMRNPLTGQVYQEGRPVEEVAKWTRLRPHLRLIDDDLFARAQVLLDANEEKWATIQDEKGRFTGPRPERAAARHLLQGLVQCGECGGNFQVCGAHGNYMGCARAKRGLCSCGTWLPRKLAEERLLRLIADHVYADSAWVDAVLAEAQACWHQQQKTNPTEHDELVRAIQADEHAIRRLAIAIETSDDDMEVLTKRLQDRSRDKRDKERRLAVLKAEVIDPGEPPTRAFVENEIRRLSEILPQGGADANTALGHLLNGGMVVREAQVEGRKRKYLIASVTLSVRGLLLAGSATPVSSRVGETPFRTFEIALRDDPPWAQFAQRVKERFDAGLEYDRIATELECPTHWVAKALAWWHTERGLPIPDGRTLKARLDRPTLAVTLADRIKTLWDAGMPMQNIAASVECSRDIVTAAIQYWFESRGLPVPDGRHRRKELNNMPQRSIELPMAKPKGDPQSDPNSVADTNANLSSGIEDPGTPMTP